MEIKVYPSILSADFANLERDVKFLEEIGADGIHLDVMDGHFVKNFSIGPDVVAAVNRSTNLFLDVHLMIYNPFDYVERFIEAGADMVTIHFEATEDVEDTLNYIRRCGRKAGLCFNPETSLSMVPKYLDKCDSILFMTVHPGFAAQNFIPSVLEKIEFTRKLCDKLQIYEGGKSFEEVKKEEKKPFEIQVDGGINLENGKRCVDAGANFLVSGSFLYKQRDMKKTILDFKNL
jgi:ribulose-phosphate 3-epimerase